MSFDFFEVLGVMGIFFMIKMNIYNRHNNLRLISIDLSANIPEKNVFLYGSLIDNDIFSGVSQDFNLFNKSII